MHREIARLVRMSMETSLCYINAQLASWGFHGRKYGYLLTMTEPIWPLRIVIVG